MQRILARVAITGAVLVIIAVSFFDVADWERVPVRRTAGVGGPIVTDGFNQSTWVARPYARLQASVCVDAFRAGRENARRVAGSRDVRYPARRPSRITNYQ